MTIDTKQLRGARRENLRRLASALGVRWDDLTPHAVLVDRVYDAIRWQKMRERLGT